MARHHLLLAALISLSMLISGCGSSDVDDGPRVADARFDGRFEITNVTIDDTERELTEQPTLEIDARFGALTVNPGCTVQLGSFTLTEDGQASFRVTGGSRRSCDGLADQEAAILVALDGAETWTTVADGFRFDGLATSISIAGPIASP